MIGAVIVLLIAWLVYSTQKNNRVFDERVSFNKRDKIPYGMYVAYNNLSHIFPEASVSVNRKDPSQWDSLNSFSDKQMLIIIVPSFRADEFEMRRLINFVKNGNSVFVSTAMVSYEVQNILHSEIPDVFDVNDNLAFNNNTDSFSVSLVDPPFSKKTNMAVQGKDSNLISLNTIQISRLYLETAYTYCPILFSLRQEEEAYISILHHLHSVIIFYCMDKILITIIKPFL